MYAVEGARGSLLSCGVPSRDVEEVSEVGGWEELRVARNAKSGERSSKTALKECPTRERRHQHKRIDTP